MKQEGPAEPQPNDRPFFKVGEEGRVRITGAMDERLRHRNLFGGKWKSEMKRMVSLALGENVNLRG